MVLFGAGRQSESAWVGTHPASRLFSGKPPGTERRIDQAEEARRRDPVATVEACHRATALTIVADIATRLGRKVFWDWDKEQFVNDETANRMLGRTLRAPWRV